MNTTLTRRRSPRPHAPAATLSYQDYFERQQTIFTSEALPDAMIELTSGELGELLVAEAAHKLGGKVAPGMDRNGDDLWVNKMSVQVKAKADKPKFWILMPDLKAEILVLVSRAIGEENASFYVLPMTIAKTLLRMDKTERAIAEKGKRPESIYLTDVEQYRDRWDYLGIGAAPSLQ